MENGKLQKLSELVVQPMSSFKQEANKELIKLDFKILLDSSTAPIASPIQVLAEEVVERIHS